MNFTLEPWREAFIPDLAEYADNPRIAVNLRDGFPQPYTQADARAFVTDSVAREGHGQLLRAVVADGRAIGSVGVFLRGGTEPELGYWLAQPFWGGGLMTRVVGLLCPLAFEAFPEADFIFAAPYAHNAASRRVLEKAGFSFEGLSNASCCSHGPVCRYVRRRTDA